MLLASERDLWIPFPDVGPLRDTGLAAPLVRPLLRPELDGSSETESKREVTCWRLGGGEVAPVREEYRWRGEEGVDCAPDWTGDRRC